MKVDLKVFSIAKGRPEVKPGDTITSFRGDKALLIRATRAAAYGLSGKVLVHWLSDEPGVQRQMEYYDKVFDLDVQMVEAEERTVSIEQISDFISMQARRLLTQIETFKVHPSYDTRANLKAEYNKLVGMLSLGLRLNEWEELPGNTRAAVENVREEIESLYKKAGK
jgi:predicted DNA-binding protein YlxM (UPF0122 family)